MRCASTFTILLILSLPGVAGAGDVLRWLGLGWGPGYHAFNSYTNGSGNCGGNSQCNGAGAARGSGFEAPVERQPASGPTWQTPTPAKKPPEALPTTPAPKPMQPQLAPPMKPSEEAMRSGRYLLPNGDYKQPDYVGQRYPRNWD